jgi:hypothetical protein
MHTSCAPLPISCFGETPRLASVLVPLIYPISVKLTDQKVDISIITPISINLITTMSPVSGPPLRSTERCHIY